MVKRTETLSATGLTPNLMEQLGTNNWRAQLSPYKNYVLPKADTQVKSFSRKQCETGDYKLYCKICDISSSLILYPICSANVTTHSTSPVIM